MSDEEPEIEPTARPPRPGPLRALLVDEDAEVRAFAAERLPPLGFELVYAASAAEADERLAAGRFDVVVVHAAIDPAGEGALCRRIRASDGGAEAVIIAMTRNDDAGGLRLLLESGADDYLPRPVPPELFVLRIDSAARRARARIRRQRAELLREVLLGISHATAATDNLEELLRVVHRELARLIDTTNFYVALHDPESGGYRFAYAVDEYDDVGSFTPEELARSATDWVRRTGRPLLLDERTAIALESAGEILPLGAPSVAWLGVPLATPRGVIGVAAVQSYDRQTTYGDDDLALMKVVADDIAMAVERKRAEEALRESEERYARAARAASDGLWDWDLVSGRVYYSARWKEAIGYRDSQVGHGPEEWLDRIHPDDRPEVDRRLAAHLGRRTRLLECEYRLSHRDGTWRWMTCRAIASLDAEGRPRRLTGSQTDVTGQRFYDPLTGLPNRSLLLDRLGRAVERGKRRPEARFALLLLDLDRLQAVNHSLGRPAGDALLLGVATRFREVAGAGRTLARLGSDEFVLLVEDLVSPDEAELIAERIHLSLVEPFAIAAHEVFVTASLGLVIDVAGKSAEELLRDAAIAVGRAKQRGRGETETFDTTMRQGAVARLRLEGDVRRALEREELRSAFQPIVALGSGRVVGFEALLRWNRPGAGASSPSEFVAVAEEIGLSTALGAGVLRRALAALAALPATTDGPATTVSVNVSAKQFARAELVDEVREALEEAGLEPARLKLEITEGTLMEDTERAISTLRRFRGMGIGIVVDDFGTGYSSLAYLPRLPLDALKIDQSFVRGVEKDREKLEIVRAIVALARNLRLEIVAEGVETAEQAAIVRGLGCELGQGFLFSAPVEASAMAEMLAAPSLPVAYRPI